MTESAQFILVAPDHDLDSQAIGRLSNAWSWCISLNGKAGAMLYTTNYECPSEAMALCVMNKQGINNAMVTEYGRVGIFDTKDKYQHLSKVWCMDGPLSRQVLGTDSFYHGDHGSIFAGSFGRCYWSPENKRRWIRNLWASYRLLADTGGHWTRLPLCLRPSFIKQPSA